MIRKLLKALLFVPLTLAMVLGIVACGGEETPGPGPGPGPETYEDYYVIDTSSIRTQVQRGEEFSLPITVTNLGEEVEDPNYSVKIVLGTNDVTETVYDVEKNTVVFTQAGVYTVTFTILKEDGTELTDKNGNAFTESIDIEAMGLRFDGMDDDAVTIDNEKLSISFGQDVADGVSVGQYSLSGVSLSGDFEVSFKVSNLSFLSNALPKLFIGFVRNSLNAEEDSFSIGAKDKQFHACVMNVGEATGANAASWNTGAFGFIDSKNTVLDTSGTHEIKIERKIVDGSAIWNIYYDGELFNTLNAGSEYSDVITRVYFTADQCGGTVSDINFTGMVSDGTQTERAETDVFDLTTTTGVARSFLGYQIYVDVYDEANTELLSTATVAFTYDGEDVTDIVYDAANGVFLAEDDGEYLMTVTAEKDGVTYLSTKTIVVWEYEASMYAFGEVDAAFGADLSNITVGTNGAISFKNMENKSSPKINYLTNVTRNWDVEFTAENLQATAYGKNIEFTLILAKNDTGALFFVDMYLLESYAFAARINSVSSDLVKYAAVSNGLDGVTVSDQFNPGEGVNVPANTDISAERTYKIACRTDENNVVTYYYFVDGVLFAKHDTSVYNGVAITSNINVSSLIGFQIKSTGMNGSFKNLTIKQVEYSVPEPPVAPEEPGNPEEPELTDAFDLSEMTISARTGLGHEVYYSVKEGFTVNADEINVTFTLDGADVTGTVYNADSKVFRPNVAGRYTMMVACGDYVSTKVVYVADDEAKLYKFGEVNTTWGDKIDKTTITKDGIRFDGMTEGQTARYNYVTNVANCWEITFKTKNMKSIKANNEWPFANLQMTLIIGSDSKQGLVFDDIMLECFPGDDCWGWAATLAGTERVAYAWAAWGVGMTATNEFKPSADFNPESVSYLAEHTWRIVCDMDENGIVTYYYFMDGKLVVIDNTSTQFGNAVANHTSYSRLFGVQFYANSLDGEVYGLQVNELTSFEIPSIPEEPELIDAFDLSETTALARTGLGHEVYYSVKDGYTVNADEINVTFTLDGADVTGTVYNADSKVFRPNVAGEYTMTVACGNNVTTKKIVVSNTEAKLYKFSEVSTEWGDKIDKTTITKDGIRFDGMTEGQTARYNYVTNVANTWEITFKTKNMKSVKANNEWPIANLQMTLIIGSDSKQGLVFDDIMLECFPKDDCWGWAATLAGTERVAYAWAAWGVGMTATNEFKPSADFNPTSVSYLAEHTWRIVCNMDENGIVTYYYYMDGTLVVIDDTSTQFGNAIANHTAYSRLFGVQFYANSLEGEVYGLQVNELTSFDVPGAANIAEVQAAELDYDLYCGKEEEI